MQGVGGRDRLPILVIVVLQIGTQANDQLDVFPVAVPFAMHKHPHVGVMGQIQAHRVVPLDHAQVSGRKLLHTHGQRLLIGEHLLLLPPLNRSYGSVGNPVGYRPPVGVLFDVDGGYLEDGGRRLDGGQVFRPPPLVADQFHSGEAEGERLPVSGHPHADVRYPLQVVDATDRPCELTQRHAHLIPGVVGTPAIHLVDDVTLTDSQAGGVCRIEGDFVLEIGVFKVHDRRVQQAFRVGPVGDGTGLVARQGVALGIRKQAMEAAVELGVAPGRAVEIQVIIVGRVGLDAGQHIGPVGVADGHLVQKGREEHILAGSVDATRIQGPVQARILEPDGLLGELAIEIRNAVVDIGTLVLIRPEVARPLGDAVFGVVEIVGDDILGYHAEVEQDLAIVIHHVLKAGLFAFRQQGHDPEFEEFDVVLGEVVQAARNHRGHAAPGPFRSVIEQIPQIQVHIVRSSFGGIVPDIERLEDVVLAEHIPVGEDIGDRNGQHFPGVPGGTGDAAETDGHRIPGEFGAEVGSGDARRQALVRQIRVHIIARNRMRGRGKLPTGRTHEADRGLASFELIDERDASLLVRIQDATAAGIGHGVCLGHARPNLREFTREADIRRRPGLQQRHTVDGAREPGGVPSAGRVEPVDRVVDGLVSDRDLVLERAIFLGEDGGSETHVGVHVVLGPQPGEGGLLDPEDVVALVIDADLLTRGQKGAVGDLDAADGVIDLVIEAFDEFTAARGDTHRSLHQGHAEEIAVADTTLIDTLDAI